MAAVNFPNNPSVNDTHTSSGSTWKWDGGVWQRLGTAGPQGVQGAQGAQGAQGHQGVQGAQGHQGRQGSVGIASLTIATSPPGSPDQGDMWWDSDDGDLHLYYNDGSSSQWANINNGPAGAQGAAGAAGAQGAQGVQGAANATTINNNANNRVITGSGTANTLEGEANMTFDGSTLRVNSEGRLNASYLQVLSDGTNPVVKIEGYNNQSSVGRIAWLVTNQYSAGSMELYHWREGMNNNGSLNIARGSNNARGGDVLAKFYYDGNTALGLGQTCGVGIGTTTVARSPLHIHRDNADCYVHVTNSTTGTGSGDGFTIHQSGVETLLNNRETGNMRLYTAGTERLRITSSGDIGIGYNSPTVKLHVREGASGFSGTYDNRYHIINESSGEAYLGFYVPDNSYAGIRFHDTTGAEAGIDYYYSSDSLQLYATDHQMFKTAGTERLRIAATGAFGLSGATYGSSGQVLTSAGSGSAPTWTTISGGVGSDAQNNTVGGENAGNALDGDTLGNTLFGENAGLAINSGDYNHFFGYEAGKSITSGNYNIAMGFESLKTATSGGGNIAIGHKAMNGGNITGANNIAIGYEAGKSFPGNINGNVAIGYRALYQQNGDRYNTAIGYEAGMNIQGAHDIVAVGHKALKNLTSGAYNTAVGWQALESLQTGTRNTAVGRGCLDNCVSGSNNTCIGLDAGMSTTAGENVMIGTNAGRTNTTGDQNVYIGTYVADSGTDGARNVCVGMYAMSSGVGSYNTLIGWATGHQINGSGGRNNTCLGYGAGYGITDGHTNICIGNEAGYSQIASDDYKLFIARGNVGPGSGSCWVYGDGAGNVIRAGNGTSWSQTSDRRIKKNIVDNSVGLDVINKIRIRNFEYRTEDEIDRTEFGGAPDDEKYTAEEAAKHDGMSEGDYYRNYGIDKSGVQLGVIAQELEEVLPNMVNTDSKTSKKTTNTDELIWHLVNAVKELSTKNDALEARLAALESS